MANSKLLREVSLWDLTSIGLLIFIAFLQLARFPSLPQFLDDFYHIQVAQGFLKSGGWCGWSFWDLAPLGRPHLYPPLYHIIVSLFLKVGIPKLITVKLLGVSMPILFFAVMWRVSRFLFNSMFSFLCLLIVFSTFPFYISLCANLPATLCIILLLLSLYFIKKDKIQSAIAFLAFSIYAHAGISISFLISLVLFSLFTSNIRIIKAVVIGSILGLPLFIHQLRYFDFLKFETLKEIYFTQYSVAVIIISILGIFICFKKKGWYLWFPCFLLSFGFVFYKYHFRFFSAQGLLPMGLLSVVFLENFITKTARNTKRIITLVFLYFFFVNSSFVLIDGKLTFEAFGSTFSEIASGGYSKFLEFQNLLYPKYLFPLRDKIIENTDENDIISSNLEGASSILGSISNRASASSMFVEVKANQEFDPYTVSKIVVWFKTVREIEEEKENSLMKSYVINSKWDKIFVNDLAYVYVTQNFSKAKTIPSTVKFPYIFTIIFMAVSFIIFDNRDSIRRAFSSKKV